MAAGNHDFLVEEEATFYRVLQLRYPGSPAVPANAITGTEAQEASEPQAVNISNQDVRCQIRQDYLETSTVKQEVEAGLIDGDNGLFYLKITPEDTAVLYPDAEKDVGWTGEPRTFHIGYYDVELEHQSSGFVTRVIEGKINYTDNITRDDP